MRFVVALGAALVFAADVSAQSVSGYDRSRLDALVEDYKSAKPVTAVPVAAPPPAPAPGPAPAPTGGATATADTCPFVLADIPGQISPLVSAADTLRETAQSALLLMGEIRQGLTELYENDNNSLQCSKELSRGIDRLTAIIDQTDVSKLREDLLVLSSCVVEKAARVQADIDAADAADNQRKRRQLAGLLTRLSEDDERIKDALIVAFEASKTKDRAIQARDAAKAECSLEIDY